MSTGLSSSLDGTLDKFYSDKQRLIFSRFGTSLETRVMITPSRALGKGEFSCRSMAELCAMSRLIDTINYRNAKIVWY